MDKKYFAVTTKCGHVGRGKYIIITFPICAESGKQAAQIARWIPRVKHHDKDCILDCYKISINEYIDLLEKNSRNPYLQCENIQKQNINCPDIYYEIKNLYEDKEDYSDRHIERVIYKQKKNKIINADVRNYFRGLNNEMSYTA